MIDFVVGWQTAVTLSLYNMADMAHVYGYKLWIIVSHSHT
jgi:hypothetical protein